MSTPTCSWGATGPRRSAAALRQRACARIVAWWKAGELGRLRVSPPRERNTDGCPRPGRPGTRARPGASWWAGPRPVPAERADVPPVGSLLRRYLLIDWGTEGGLTIFCAVLALEPVPVRSVRYGRAPGDHPRLLAECIEDLGGVRRGAWPTGWPETAVQTELPVEVHASVGPRSGSSESRSPRPPGRR